MYVQMTQQKLILTHPRTDNPYLTYGILLYHFNLKIYNQQ
jgi:hypothetical protein